MIFVELIGLAAGILTTISFLPQVIKTWKTRTAKDISLLMFLCFCSGVLLWIVYGLFLKSVPIVAANVVTFILAFTILVFKLKYG
jgi:MtN3 and saliva related transmembrane protein